MTHCIKCHRPLKYPTATGMGRVCAKNSAPAPVHERDLFGFDVDKAVEAARYRVGIHIESMTVSVHMALRRAFLREKVRARLWQ